MKTFFTSDPHFDDPRLNLFGRDILFDTARQVDNHIIKRWNKTVSQEDEVFVLGDAALSKKGLQKFSRLNGKKILIKGNYDEPETAKYKVSGKLLRKYFDFVVDTGEIEITLIDGTKETVFLNHFPTLCKKDMFNITGHIHGLWKVQRNMINVGLDAWHFTPVSEERIAFQINGIRNHYDQNVFAGELYANSYGYF